MRGDRGGRFDGRIAGAPHVVYARTFAAVYAVMLTFEGEPPLSDVRRAVAHALPRIDALTTALPPTDDPSPRRAAAVD